MQLAQLRMTSQMAKIRISQSKGTQEIQQPKATLHIAQPHAKLNIRTSPPKLKINQSKAWEDMNLLSPRKSIAAFSQAGKSGALEGMGRRAKEGRELMEIEKGGSPLVEQAVKHAYPKQKQLGIEFIPSHFSVQTTYRPGNVNIDVARREPIIDAEANKPVHRFDRGDVSTSMRQYADLQIDVINLYA